MQTVIIIIINLLIISLLLDISVEKSIKHERIIIKCRILAIIMRRNIGRYCLRTLGAANKRNLVSEIEKDL